MRVPHTNPAVWGVTIAPGRFASLLEHGVDPDARVALIGLPDDAGVRLNGGRVGAADGPRAFRAALARLGVARPDGWEYPRVCDAGDVQPGGSLEETHERVTEAVEAILDMGLLPVGIGGGHDLTFPFVRAATRKVGVRSGVYFDAHLDVRAERGSGMPFRKLIEECGVSALVNVGADRLVNSAEHWRYFESHGGRVGAFEPEPWPMLDGGQFVSFDLDVLDASVATGVSAMNPCGMSMQVAARYVHAAGRSLRVMCFDIMELCPAHDVDGRTARAAAYLFLSFLRGVAERGGAKMA
jgi:arginase family enzyme